MPPLSTALHRVLVHCRPQITCTSYTTTKHARRSLSTVGGTHVCPPQPWREIDGQSSGQSTPHYCPPLIHLHSPPPPKRCKVSQQVWNSHELNLNLHFTLLWPSWLDYRVPTTPCTKRLKTLSTYQENIAWIKSSWYYSRNMGGGHSWSCPPGPNIGGTCPPCPIGIDAPATKADSMTSGDWSRPANTWTGHVDVVDL